MYPALPLGPITLPTGAFLAFVAVYLGLEVAGRYGRRLGLRLDDVWNTGLIAVATGLIVARLWNVIQFSYVYSAEPGLLLSVRPSGFSLLPGIIGALAGAYVYLWRRRLSPSAMAAAFAAGGLLFLAVLGISDYLTGAVIGLPSDRPWARPFFGVAVHPVGLYRAAGFVLALAVLWVAGDRSHPNRVTALALLLGGLVHLVADGFTAEAQLWGDFRVSQLLALGAIAVGGYWLARSVTPAGEATPAAPLAPPAESRSQS